MSDNMYMCNSCHTFYPPAVACQVKNKKCSCGGVLVSTNISADNCKKLTASRLVSPSSSAPAAVPAAPAPSAPSAPVRVQYRKKPVPEEYSVKDTPASSGCLLSLSFLGLVFYGISQFLDGNFGSAVFAACAFIAIYIFVRMYDRLSAAVAHLGAIRWLLVHGDELEPVPDPAERSAHNKQKGPQISDKAFSVACIVLIVLMVGGLLLYNHLQ